MKKLIALFLFIQFLAHWGMATSAPVGSHEFLLWEDIDWDNIQVLEMEEDDLSLDFDIPRESTFGEREEERLALAPLVPLVAILSVGSAAFGCVATKDIVSTDHENPVVRSGTLGAIVGMRTVFLAFLTTIAVEGPVFAESLVAAPYAWPIFVPIFFGAAGGVLCYKVAKNGEDQERPLSQP